jgi:hypothetical protein
MKKTAKDMMVFMFRRRALSSVDNSSIEQDRYYADCDSSRRLYDPRNVISSKKEWFKWDDLHSSFRRLFVDMESEMMIRNSEFAIHCR